ncbi:hypothetical protein [Streptomyces sp. MUM 203J]|uniref:hypothetical protein n=1 Tax=Streptomyces sp. MUM 203J TaxID=2791990 RepID=UPI001F04C038|nr:hypothetical protein [Streptomyces sp. MUM 203J]
MTMAMLRRTRGRPDDELLRRALRNWAFVMPRPDARIAPAEVRLALDWVARASRPLDDLLDPVVMRGVLQALRLKHDGTIAAVETQRRKRTTLVNSVPYAIELGRLRTDPLAHVSWRITETVQQVDPRVVVNPAQAWNLLCAVSYVGGYERARARGRRLAGLFAGMYYAGRPAALGPVHLVEHRRRSHRGRRTGGQQRQGPHDLVREVPLRSPGPRQRAHRRASGRMQLRGRQLLVVNPAAHVDLVS